MIREEQYCPQKKPEKTNKQKNPNIPFYKMQCIYNHKNLLLLYKNNVQSYSENQIRKCTIIYCWLLRKDYLFHPQLWLKWTQQKLLKSSSGAAKQPIQLEEVPDINLGSPKEVLGERYQKKPVMNMTRGSPRTLHMGKSDVLSNPNNILQHFCSLPFEKLQKL